MKFQRIMVRYYDDGHQDWEILWYFKRIKTIENGSYSSISLAIRNDWVLWILKETEVSGMNNPKNWWSRYSFDEVWNRDLIMGFFNN